jgi:hypothetical protein
MWSIRIIDDRLVIGERFAVSFQRTLRLPDDGKTYPLPPTLGVFPLRRAADYAGRVPEEWLKGEGVFFPMFQREAMWLAFEAQFWKPNAVKLAVGRINVVTGNPWDEGLHAHPQDYLVCPDQPWLDGINSGKETIRQFVAMPLGSGYTIEGQLTGEERFGGLQIQVYDPMPGRFPDKPPPSPPGAGLGMPMMGPLAGNLLGFQPPQAAPVQSMGLAAGGKMKQKIYPDPYGIDAWDQDHFGEVMVHIINSLQYQQITGQAPPSTPVDAQTYTRHGLPWFDLYDEAMGDLAPSEKLEGVKSIKEKDQEKGIEEEEPSVDVKPEQVKKIDLKDKEKGRHGQEKAD